jgi:HD-like signal output (HDOD) protein
MDKTSALNALVEQAQRGELIFSASVATSLKVKEAIEDPDCSVDAASKIILNEPVLAARVVAIANSAAYNRSGMEVSNLKGAINRIGFNTLRAIVSSLVVKQIAGASKNPVIRAKINQLWEHSAQVAALAQILARRVTKLDPDTAMFAGIIHEVGGFYVLSRAEEYPSLLEPDSLEVTDSNTLPGFVNTFIEKESPEAIIGRVVLNNLKAPQAVVEAVEALWFGMRAMPPESFGDTLLLANELAWTSSPLDTRTDTPNDRYTSEIDFVVGDGSLQSILEESEDEVKTLSAALIV